MTSHKLDLSTALAFMLAGKATFTIRNSNTGTRFTYKITIPKNQSKEGSKVFWVNVLTGSNNESDYTYAGSINARTKAYTHGVNSSVGFNAPSIIALNWTLTLLARGGTSNLLEVWHEGTCCRCGRKLTTPESLITGFGPICDGIKTNALQARLFA